MLSEKYITKNWDPKKPKISIICRAFNHERFISKCIDSILKQKTSYPFKIIVNDDCSTDSTPKKLKFYEKNYPNIIRVLYQERNYFLSTEKPSLSIEKEIEGDYVGYCEGDDFWISDKKIERQLEFLSKNKDYSCCFHDYMILDESLGRFLCSYSHRNPELEEGLDGTVAQNSLKKAIVNIRSPTRVVRASVHFDLMELREKYLVKSVRVPGDNFYTAVMPSFGKSMYFGSFKGAVFRRHNESSWNPTSMAYKNEMRSHLAIALTKFFTDQNDREMADYWHQQALSRLDMCLTEIKSSTGN